MSAYYYMHHVVSIGRTHFFLFFFIKSPFLTIIQQNELFFAIPTLHTTWVPAFKRKQTID